MVAPESAVTQRSTSGTVYCSSVARWAAASSPNTASSARRQGGGAQRSRDGQHERDWQPPRSDRPRPLQRVAGIVLAIGGVVRQVHGARGDAEDRERAQLAQDGGAVEEPSAEHEAREDE